MNPQLKHKKWVYALAPVLLILLCAALMVLSGLVGVTNRQLEDYREEIFQAENNPGYNRFGLLGEQTLSTELLADTGEALVYSDRVIKKLAFKEDAAQQFADSMYALQAVVGENAGIVVLPVPKRAQYEKVCGESATALYGEFLETLAGELPGDVRLADACAALAEDDEHQLFYRTDDTWTMDGAYYGYRAVCEALGITPREMDAFDFYSVNSFTGTLAQSVLEREYLGSSVDFESIRNGIAPDRFIFRYSRDFKNYEVVNSVNYGVYKRPVILHTLAGATGVIGDKFIYAQIDGKGEGSVMVVGDAAGKCIVPYLTEHFGKIVVVNMQHCYTEMMLELAAESGIKTFVIAQKADEIGSSAYSRALNELLR